jgi:hypothetical protein
MGIQKIFDNVEHNTVFYQQITDITGISYFVREISLKFRERNQRTILSMVKAFLHFGYYGLMTGLLKKH